MFLSVARYKDGWAHPPIAQLLSIFSGIALVPAGWQRHKTIKAGYFVPAVAFVILGIALMIFALGLVSFSLAQFVRNWWPLLLVLAGLVLVLVSVSKKFSEYIKR